ncbi:MAG TPA: PA14 domain-containing protein [Polyangia bacterium]
MKGAGNDMQITRRTPPSVRVVIVAVMAALISVACVDLARPTSLVDAGAGGHTGAGGGVVPSDDGGANNDAAIDADDGGNAAGGAGGTGGVGGTGGDGGAGAGGEGGGGAGAAGGTTAGADAGTGGGGADAPVDLPVTKLGLGAACSMAVECDSNFCVDGVCCNDACSGTCRTCAQTKGMCQMAASGTDPRNTCADDGASTCQRNGMCDGAGACQRYPSNTVCAPASCNNGQITTASRCDATGACRPGAGSSCVPYACTSTGNPSCRSLCFSKADCAGSAECFGGVCGGLLGTYFATDALTGRSVTRVDRNIDFTFDSAPIATIPGDMFSIRWTGKVVAPSTGVYNFSTLGDDGVRLWINDQLVINDWRIHSPEEWGGQTSMTAGTPVSFKLEYFDSTGSGVVRLFWAGPGVAKQIVPVTAFRPE